ncbi:MAG: hypothetical protein VX899_17510 [Myxococcota bacterium]|nr:hypothetical protein [Myxococcota bacterium]
MLLLLLACKTPEPVPFDPLAVFPSSELVSDGHLDIPQDLLTAAETPLPVARLEHRSGFSVVQTTVFDLGVQIDPSSLPGLDQVDQAGSVQIWDLTVGERLPCWAEVDAYPQDTEIPTLLVRPAAPLPVGHQVAVIVLDSVRTSEDTPVPSPAWWTAAQAGEPLEGADSAHWAGLATSLAELGVEGVVAATDFPVGEGTAPLRHMAASTQTPTEFSLYKVSDVDEGAAVEPGTWRLIQGHFRVPSYLNEDGAFTLDSEGLPIEQGSYDADLMVLVPESARAGADAVWIFGHGIFSGPGDYLDVEGDSNGVIALANEARAIVVATRWRGLTRTDLPSAVAAGNDFGRIVEVTDKLAQGVADTLALERLIVDGALFDDPALAGLWDGEHLGYYGISLGGIQGATFLSLQEDIEFGVLHVGGSAWSTMLERSANWTLFEELLVPSIPSAGDRQRLYAASQLYWDVSDPAGFTAELQGVDTLWQVALGDEQVPNRTTWLLARGAEMPQVGPAVEEVWGLSQIEAGQDSRGVVIFDPQRGLPAEANRPAEVTGAHTSPRVWSGARLQAARYLDPSDPGVIAHYCGEDPCTADNPGP